MGTRQGKGLGYTRAMPLTFHEHRLPNGLTIVGEVDPDAHSAACGFYVRTGARDEDPAVMGVSHFLEHMMFKGTQEITAEALNRAFDDMGARNNAFTSNEMTCFYAHLLPERLDAGVELLARMMRPALRQEDFDTEKGVILEEIAMYQDNPFWVLYESSTEKHFGTHTLAHRVLGTAKTITDLTRTQMLHYFNARYAADNTVVSLAGRLDFAQACERIEELCGSWAATGVTRDSTRPALAGGALELHDAKVNRGYLLALADAPAMDDERRYAAMLLAQVLGASDNSRLHWALIETGLAEEAQAGYEPHDGVGEFMLFAVAEPSRLDEVWSVMQRELDSLIDSITPDDLVRLTNKVATGATVGGERPHDRMHRLGRLWTYLERYIPLEDEVDRISSVTLDDLRETHKAFPIRPVTVGRLLPA